jgi:hypothetical protein
MFDIMLFTFKILKNCFMLLGFVNDQTTVKN